MIPSIDDIARLSLEFAVLCDPAGVVLSADEDAQQRLRVAPGGAAAYLCVPGATAKAQELTGKASAAPDDRWERSFVVDRRPLRVSFCAAPCIGGDLETGL
jgi:hypothetical protein